jgi:hypothetical protein
VKRSASRSTRCPGSCGLACVRIPGTPRSSRCPEWSRCWRRCSWPRSARPLGSRTRPGLVSWAGLTPRHRESDTTVRRGPITKQGSGLARWAAIEAAQKMPASAGWLVSSRARIAQRRGRNVATVAVAGKLLTLVYSAGIVRRPAGSIRPPTSRRQMRQTRSSPARQPVDRPPLLHG